jgi:hypothetical protein
MNMMSAIIGVEKGLMAKGKISLEEICILDF